MPYLLSIVGCAFAIASKPLLLVPVDSAFHFSLITVNALFGGFLYTNYSLLIGLLDNAIVDKIKTTDIIVKRNAHILKGIVYATISVIAGLYLVLFSPTGSFLLKTIYLVALNAEIVFMTFLIIYFLLSLREMSMLISNIHNQKGKKSNDEIKRLRQEIKDNAKK